MDDKGKEHLALCYKTPCSHTWQVGHHETKVYYNVKNALHCATKHPCHTPCRRDTMKQRCITNIKNALHCATKHPCHAPCRWDTMRQRCITKVKNIQHCAIKHPCHTPGRWDTMRRRWTTKKKKLSIAMLNTAARTYQWCTSIIVITIEQIVLYKDYLKQMVLISTFAFLLR